MAGEAIPGRGSHRGLAYAAMGMLMAAGAPCGLLLFRWAQRGEASLRWLHGEIVSDLALYTYVTVSTAVVFSVFGLVLGLGADRLVVLSRIDALTGLLSRRAFVDRLEQEQVRALRYPQVVSLLLLDLDGLKAINDRHGHMAGDAALAALGTAIREGLRAADVAGRWGGDEFAVLAPQTPEDAALRLAERIRRLAESAIPRAGPGFTVSVGVAIAEAGRPWPVAEILEAADHALYDAKGGGRNRVAFRKMPPA